MKRRHGGGYFVVNGGVVTGGRKKRRRRMKGGALPVNSGYGLSKVGPMVIHEYIPVRGWSGFISTAL
jgi:hypothetical protein